jgi:vacuolar-type H+-ATPase subunit H
MKETVIDIDAFLSGSQAKNSTNENQQVIDIDSFLSGHYKQNPENETQETSLKRLGKMPLAGAASTIEGMINVPSYILDMMMPIVIERLNEVYKASEPKPIPASHDFMRTNAISEGVQKVLGEDLTPRTTKEKVAHGIGEFLVGFPGGGNLVAKTATATAKNIAKKSASHIGEAAAISGAIHGTPRITQEGSASGMAEDLVKGIAGGTAFGAGKALLNPKQTLAHVSTLGAKPAEDVLKIAEENSIDLPVNVGLNSSPLNAMTNLLKHSPFSAEKFKESFTRANTQILNAIRKQLDKLGPDVAPSAAGHDFNQFLKSQEKEVNKEVSKMYDEARKHLNPKDAVNITNTQETVNAMKDILNRDIKSPQTQKVTNVVAKLAQSWGILPKNIKLPKNWDNEEISPKILNQIIKAFEKETPVIPIQKLMAAKTEIGNILKHKQDVVGMERWLKSIQRSISEDISTTTNSKFKESQKLADKFYQENYASRFKEDLTNSVLNGSPPLYIYEKLKTAESVRTLEKIAGAEPKARQMVDALKKAKAREVFNNTIKEDGIHAGNYSKIFNKNEVNQEYLKELLGQDVYRNLNKLSKITSAMSKAGQDMLNTSSTAYTQQYINTLSKIGSGLAGAVMLSVGATKTLGAGAATVGVNQYLSRLLVDPEYVKLARQFAIYNSLGKPQLSVFRNLVNRAALISRHEINEENKD